MAHSLILCSCDCDFCWYQALQPDWYLTATLAHILPISPASILPIILADFLSATLVNVLPATLANFQLVCTLPDITTGMVRWYSLSLHWCSVFLSIIIHYPISAYFTNYYTVGICSSCKLRYTYLYWLTCNALNYLFPFYVAISTSLHICYFEYSIFSDLLSYSWARASANMFIHTSCLASRPYNHSHYHIVIYCISLKFFSCSSCLTHTFSPKFNATSIFCPLCNAEILHVFLLFSYKQFK